MQSFDERSAATGALLADERFVSLGALTGDGHVHRRRPGNKIEALFKPIGVAHGISDVPWHKDCSLGRHSYECCAITAGISVTGAGPGTGQLRVTAGSHRALVWPSLQDVEADLDLPVVDLATETGDVTLHLSCTLHMAEPPVTAERRVMYTTFGLPPADPEASMAANRRLLSATRDQAAKNTSQVPAPAR
jgi:ectoine hydroxylase-related dioxygenase (phytanoyl-CoA dioxygenase family)